MRDSFILYTESAEQIGMLTREQRGDLLTAIMAYETEKSLPEMDPMTAMVFSMIRQRLDRDAEKYDAKRKKNAENARSRWDANAYDRMPKDANACDRISTDATENGRINSHSDNDPVPDPVPDNVPDLDPDNGPVPDKPKNHKARKRAEVVYDTDPEVNEAVKEFIRHRRVLKCPMTDRGIDLFLARLRGMSRDPTEQVRLINTAIERGWKTVYKDKKPDGKIDWSTV